MILVLSFVLVLGAGDRMLPVQGYATKEACEAAVVAFDAPTHLVGNWARCIPAPDVWPPLQ